MGNDVSKLKQRLEVREYLVLAGMLLLFFGAIWLIFASFEEERRKEKRNAESNIEPPDSRGAGIEGDKIAVCERVDMKRKQTEKLRVLEDFSEMADRDSGTTAGLSPNAGIKNGSSRGDDRRSGACSSSASIYNNINRTLGSFHEPSQEDPEEEALKAEVERLKQAVTTQNAQPGYEEQVALLEKSYELTAGYMPGNGGANTDSRFDNESPGWNGEARAVPVGLVSTSMVLSLPQPASDSIQLTGMAQPGRFHTPTGNREEKNVRDTIRACTHGDQTATSDQGVRIRLPEPMHVGKYILPEDSLPTERGRIQDGRFYVSIFQAEYGGIIISVESIVHDNDGQGGTFTPGLTEANAIREAAVNLGQSLGTGISTTNQSANDQLFSELGKGVIQGVPRYISRKMRGEKVHLKLGYTLMFYQDNNQ